MTEVQQAPIDRYSALAQLQLAICDLLPALQQSGSKARSVRLQPLCTEKPVRAWRLGSPEKRLPFCIDAAGTLYRIYEPNSGDRKDGWTVVSITLKENAAMAVRCTEAIRALHAELCGASADT